MSIFYIKYGLNEYFNWRRNYKGICALKLAHSLEKGMSMPSATPGHGIQKAEKLIGYLEQRKLGSFEIAESISVLREYFRFQRKHNYNVNEQEKRFSLLLKTLSGETCSFHEAGSMDYSYKPNNASFDLYEYLSNRHSVRDFNMDECVDEERINEAIKIATLAPSACNRQPCKIYYSLNRRISSQIGNIIPGNKGFRDRIPYYAVITTNRALFDPEEMYQWLFNAGIFTAYFLNGLYSQGIGSCIFQFANANKKLSETMKKLLSICDDECICCVIGFGEYKEKMSVLYATRKNADEISEKI